MNVWHNLSEFVPVAGQTRSADRPAPIRRSEPIEVDGVVVGTAIQHELGVQFIALRTQVSPMDQSIWPSTEYAYRAARQLYKSRHAEK